METLQHFITTGVFAFILTFVRVGTALMIMPGLGDSFTPQNVRLHLALALALVMAPVVAPHMPDPIPGTTMLLSLIVMEFIIGMFIGTVARILMAALDTAGMIMSMQSGLGNAQLFNPAFSTQGSILGAFLSVMGMVLVFSTNLHHLLIMGVADSYNMFPVGSLPDVGGMANMIGQAISASFRIGVQVTATFIVVGLMIYIGMGVLSRLMPQIQVFMIAIPVQILISLMTLALILSAGMLFWLHQFEEGMVFFLMSSGG